MQEVNTHINVSGSSELVGFFDLLARFDFEDKQKSGINTDLSASAPGRSILASEYSPITQ